MFRPLHTGCVTNKPQGNGNVYIKIGICDRNTGKRSYEKVLTGHFEDCGEKVETEGLKDELKL